MKSDHPDNFDAGLVSGEYTLEDALMMTLLAGAPASPYLIACMEAAFNDQREGRRQLSESFGTGRHGNEAQAMESELVSRQVFDLVTELHRKHAKGHPEHLALTRQQARTTRQGETAFSKAAAMLKLSESAVVKHYGRGKLLQLAEPLHERDKG